ncbi:MAG: geranylgeranyl diphosphate reductase [Gammaproteobacteria bacterium]
MDNYDVAVIGGGPTGATAANDLALAGKRVLLLDRDGRIKPCGGAVPPILVREFDIPESLLEAKVTTARMISPENVKVDMPVGGWVGMVNRSTFDEWLRERAASNGATRATGKFLKVVRDDETSPIVEFKDSEGQTQRIRAKAIIGADGAVSNVAKQCLADQGVLPNVFAYHEIVRSPAANDEVKAAETAGDFDPERCDVYYQGSCSPDFYGWVFPHGEETSVGMGTAVQGFSLRGSVSLLRENAGLTNAETVRTEGAPIPLKTRKRWDNGRDVVVSGDAAGAVAPASGEGIYYAMISGRCAAQAVEEFLVTGKPKALKLARKRFMKMHGRVFFILGIMQKFWYSSDKRRERFVSICKDPDVQVLTWEAYMNKKLVKAKPVAHIRIFFKDMAHLLGLAPR